MVDSNLIAPAEYEMYFSKFMIEAKQELRKQAIAEKKKLIDEAEESKKEKKSIDYYDRYNDADKGNEDLGVYATLLLPFADKYNTVMPLIEQMLKSSDKRLKYNTLCLLLKKGKPYPDTLVEYYATLDEYRYELFTDLKKMKMSNKFPGLYRNHLDLGRSKLLAYRGYDKPDSLLFIDRASLTYKGKAGFVYFFKYKDDKEDLVWKLATVGLVPADIADIEFTEARISGEKLYTTYNEDSEYDFTEFSKEVIKEDVPITQQLPKYLKKILYSRKNSGARFYSDDYEAAPQERYLD
jgi:hypothetical protein